MRRYVFHKGSSPDGRTVYTVVTVNERDVPLAVIGFVRKQEGSWRTWEYQEWSGGEWTAMRSGRTREDAADRLSALWAAATGEVRFRKNNPGPTILARAAENIDRIVARMEEDLRRVKYPYYISSLGERTREAANRIRLAAKWEEEDVRS